MPILFEAGIDGMIIPDLPFADYLSNYKSVADKYGLKMIMLITPETSEERIRLIDKHTEGLSTWYRAPQPPVHSSNLMKANKPISQGLPG